MLTISKEKLLKKLLVKSAVIVSLALAILISAAFYLSNYNDSMEAEQSLKQGQNNTISSEYREIETNLGLQNEVAKYHDNYVKDHNENFTINRETVTELLSSLRKIHHLSNNIEVTVSPIADVSENTFTIKSGKAVKSTVHITFGALSDNSVYNLIHDLQHKLPGIVMISELKIVKSGELSKNSVLLATNQHTLVPMVTGDLTFTWIGIRSNQENANGAK